MGTWQGLGMVLWLRLEVEEEELEEGQISTEWSRSIPIRLRDGASWVPQRFCSYRLMSKGALGFGPHLARKC